MLSSIQRFSGLFCGFCCCSLLVLSLVNVLAVSQVAAVATKGSFGNVRFPYHSHSFGMTGGLSFDLYNQSSIFMSGQPLIEMSLDPALNNITSVFLTKFNNELNSYEWLVSFNKTDNVKIHGLKAVDSENVLVLGVYSKKVDMYGFNDSSAIDNNMFLAKHGPMGQVIWAKSSFRGSGIVPGDIKVDETDGSIFVSGYFYGSVNFTSTFQDPYSSNNRLFVAKFNSTGEYEWVVTSDAIDGTFIDASSDVVYIGGLFGFDADFGQHRLTSNTSNVNAFVGMLDKTDGEWLGVVSLAGDYDTFVRGMVVNSVGNVYVDCQSWPEKDRVDTKLIRLDSNLGNRQDLIEKKNQVLSWETNGLALASNDNVLLLSVANSDKDPSVGPYTQTTTSYDSSGVEKWAASIGSDFIKQSNIRVGVDGSMFIYGFVRGASSFGSQYIDPSAGGLIAYLAETLSTPEYNCFGTPSYNRATCSGLGKCVGNDVCSCKSNVFGANCDSFQCFSKWNNESSVCNGQGGCVDHNTCKCNSKYYGLECDYEIFDITIESNHKKALFNRQQSLLATGAFDPPSRITNFGFEWTLERSGVVQDISKLLKEGQSNIMRTISFKEGSLQPNSLYHLRLNTTAKANLKNVKQAEIIIQTSSPPGSGSFTVTSLNQGRVLVDLFDFVANGWVSSETPNTLEYRYGYFDDKGRKLWLNSFSQNTRLSVTIPVSGSIKTVVQVRSYYGEVAEVTKTIAVMTSNSADLQQSLQTNQQVLSQGNSTAVETSLALISSMLNSEIFGSNATVSLINILVDSIVNRENDISVDSRVQTIRLIADKIQSMNEEQIIQVATLTLNILQKTDDIDQEILEQLLETAKDLASVMIGSGSTSDQMSVFRELLDHISKEIRATMIEGQTESISMPNVETTTSRIGRTENSLGQTNTTIQVAVPGSKSSTGQTIFVRIINSVLVSEKNLPEEPSVFVQGQSFAHGSDSDQYPSECNTKLASPRLTLQLFNEKQAKVDSSTTEPAFLTKLPVPESLSPSNTSFSYVCKYFNGSSWVNDTSVCSTEHSESDIRSDGSEQHYVLCSCSRPVQHAVALDYVQSSEDIVEDVCMNPCGCGQRKQKPGLAAWAVALIVLACCSVVLIVVVVSVLLLILVSSKAGFISKSSNLEIEARELGLIQQK